MLQLTKQRHRNDGGGQENRNLPSENHARLRGLNPRGSGMNSLSPGTGAKRPAAHWRLALSIRSRLEATKFHQMKRGVREALPAEQYHSRGAAGAERLGIAA